MPCFKPSQMTEFIIPSTGVVFFRFNHSKNFPVCEILKGNVKVVREFPKACEQCSGCRSKASRNWGIRCYHESLFHEHNCFITLTVSEQYLEFVFPGGSLSYDQFQKFLRRLRKKIKNEVRFIMCGEYGTEFSRPHYHAIIFGFCPMSQFKGDTEVIKRSPTGNLYSSRILSELWEFGYSSVGYFDIGCANYVAGYIHKKINGRLQDSWYKGLKPEFAKMSLKPGIGAKFYEKFTSDMYRQDKVTLPGKIQFPIPRYYDVKHAFYHPGHMAKVKLKRLEPNSIRDSLNVPERLAAREVIMKARLKLKSRSYESGGGL